MIAYISTCFLNNAQHLKELCLIHQIYDFGGEGLGHTWGCSGFILLAPHLGITPSGARVAIWGA